MREISLFHPFIPEQDILRELKTTLKSRWIGQAHKVNEFEEKFAKKYGYKYVLFVNSGTAALELSYHLLDMKPGDEVIVPVLDCTAGQMGLLRRGVKIVFADVSENLTIDYEDVKSKITDKTKAIVAVNLGGIEADKKIYKLGVPVITDSAQHLGNTKGDYIVYSFQAIKHITCGDGGMLVLTNKKEYDRAKKLRWFGIDRELKAKKNWQAWEKREMTFDIEEAGYKYQPTDIDACFALAGLKHADDIVKKREALANIYNANLPKGIVKISGGTHWLYGILTDKRDKLADHLKKNGVETNLVHLRNDIFKVFGGKRQKLPNMDFMENHYLYLPLHQKMNEQDALYVCKLVNEVCKD